MGRNAHLDLFRSSRAHAHEDVISSLPGWIGKQFDRDQPPKGGMLLLTTERLVFIRKGWLGEIFQAIRLEEITAVWDESTLGRRILNVRAGSLAFEFRTLAPADAMAAFLRSLEAQRRRGNSTAPSETGVIAQPAAPFGTVHAPTKPSGAAALLRQTAAFLLSCFLGFILFGVIHQLGGVASPGGVTLFSAVVAITILSLIWPGSIGRRFFILGRRANSAAVLAFVLLALAPAPPTDGASANAPPGQVATPPSASNQPPQALASPQPRAEAPQTAAPIGPERPDSLRLPVALCSLLLPVGIDAGNTWRPSNAVAGGWTCSGAGRWVEFGPPGLDNHSSNLTYFIFGGGARQLDRIVLKLNLFQPSVAGEGKERLTQASNIVARHFGIEIPANLVEAIRREQPRMLRQAPTGPRRVIASATQNDFVIEVGVEQSRITTLVVVFRNVRETGIWRL